MVGRFWLGSSVLSGGGEQVIFNNNKLFLRISSCFEGFRCEPRDLQSCVCNLMSAVTLPLVVAHAHMLLICVKSDGIELHTWTVQCLCVQYYYYTCTILVYLVCFNILFVVHVYLFIMHVYSCLWLWFGYWLIGWLLLRSPKGPTSPPSLLHHYSWRATCSKVSWSARIWPSKPAHSGEGPPACSNVRAHHWRQFWCLPPGQPPIDRWQRYN